MSTPHQAESLGAYVLGALDAGEASEVERHLATCPACRQELASLHAMRAALDDLPPEAMLDGPPDDGDLLLQRTLRGAREDRNRGVRRRRLTTVSAAAVVVAAAIGGGLVVGRGTAPEQIAQPPGPPSVSAAPPSAAPPSGAPAGTRTGTAVAGSVRMTAVVKPAMGWVRVTATAVGIPAGQRCRLIVVAKDGTRQEAGSWLVSKKGEKQPTPVDGSALVAPADVAAVEVENFDGHQFATVPF